MMHSKLYVGMAILYFGLVSCQPSSNYKSIFSQYRNIKQPVVFAPELSIKGNTYKGCFSNDYSTFLFFRHNKPGTNAEDYRIFQSSFTGKQWTKPTTINFSDSNSDLYPIASPMERDKLFFISFRRTPSNSSNKLNANFWYSIKTGGNWLAPIPFDTVNLIYNYNSQPCITKSGNMYFTSELPDWSKKLTYKIEFKNGAYQRPVPFEFVNQLRAVDTTRSFWEVCVSPDEKYMVMTISEKGKAAKLFVSFRKADQWTTPQYIGDIIHDDMSGNFPYITPEGSFLIFTKGFSSFYILPTKLFANNSG